MAITLKDFHLQYRPQTLDEIVGQSHIVASLTRLFEKENLPHAYLFQGPSGCGKTTLSRIIAYHLHCTERNIIELDAGRFTGIESMRTLIEGLCYPAVGPNPIKFVIMDEVHSLSKAAWQSVLKILEEPPPHVYFSLCTTEPGKVPDTIQTRCHIYNLKDVEQEEIEDLISAVSEMEEIVLPEGSVPLIALRSQGSPRRSLVYLSQCAGAVDLKEVSKILEQPLEDSEVIELCRLLASGSASWEKVAPILKSLKGMNPESIRIQLVNYFAAAVLNSKKKDGAFRFLQILECFSKPYTQQTGFAELLLSVGEVLQ